MAYNQQFSEASRRFNAAVSLEGVAAAQPSLLGVDQQSAAHHMSQYLDITRQWPQHYQQWQHHNQQFFKHY